MKYIFTLLLLVTSFTILLAQKTSAFHYDVKIENTQPRKITRLLMLASGPMSSRKVAQDLKTALDKEFKKRNVNTVFVFLGDFDANTPDNIRNAASKNPNDAILVITPQTVNNTTLVDSRSQVSGSISNGFYGPTDPSQWKTKEGVQQFSKFDFVEENNIENPFWSADLKIQTALDAEKIYRKLANALIKSWEQQQILLGK